MRINNKMSLLAGIVSAFVLLAVGSVAFAAHPSVALLDANGAPVTGNTPYSPKQTCSMAACHANPDPAVSGPSHDYGSGSELSTHTQGVIAADDKIYWQSYDVKSFEHGASVGRHMNQGRNENFSNTFRANFGLPFFTSSPGMFGKF